MKNRIIDHDFGRLSHNIVDHGILARMSGLTCKIYVVLVRHAHYSRLNCYPSRTTIVKESGVSKNKITACLNELKGLGLILVKRSGRRFGFRNIYFLVSHPPKPVLSVLLRPKRISPVIKDKCTGRFCKSLNTGDRTSPHPKDSNTCPYPEDEKEIKRKKIETVQELQILDSVNDPRLKQSLLSLRRNLERREAEG